MKNKKTIYYTDELNDEFSTAKITPRVIDENYIYLHKNILWRFVAFILHNIVIPPIRVIYTKLKFKIKFIGKEKLKKYKKQGYFVYVNHTQEFADTLVPSIPIFPKRNYFIVNPENVSIRGLGNSIQMIGAIPIPINKLAMKNFIEAIQKLCQKNAITIYPEAHIWPYYTKIRPFKDVSFAYPIKFNKPTFCMTNTYQKRKNGKVKIVTYIDGPFFWDNSLSKKDQKADLRNKVYNTMVERSKNSNFEYIKYVKKPS